MKELQKYNKNKKEGRTPTEKVIGLGKTEEFAAFGRNYAEDIELMRQAFLLDFCESSNFTAEQLKYFRMGLDIMPAFFRSCVSEIDSKKQTQG